MAANLVAAPHQLCSNVQVKSLRTFFAATILLAIFSPSAVPTKELGHLVAIHRDQMCVTKGAIEQKSAAELEATAGLLQ